MPKIVDANDRRAALAEAAARLISTVGLEGLRLRDVAAEAGWTTGALTHYFPGKRDLLIMAMRMSMEALQGRQDEVTHSQGDELRSLLENALPLDEDRVRHLRVSRALSVQSWNDAEIRGIHLKAYRRWRRRIANLLAAGIEDGRFLSDLDPEQGADELIATVDGVALQAQLDPQRWLAAKQLAFLDRHLARFAG